MAEDFVHTLLGWSAVCATVDIIKAMIMPLVAPNRRESTMSPADV